MAAAAVLQQPRSQSHEMTSLSSEISQARQRRRRSTRRSEGPIRSRKLDTQGTADLSQELRPPALIADDVITSDAASSILNSTVGSVDSILTGTFQIGQTQCDK